MTAPPRRNLHDLFRWCACAVIVAAAHGGIGAALLWPDESAGGAEQSGAFVVELAELPVMRPDIPLDIAPGPDQVQNRAIPELQALKEAEDEPLPTLPPARDAEAVLPAAVEEPQKKEDQASQPQNPAPATTALQAVADRQGQVAMAPVQAAPRQTASNAVPDWQSRLQTHLERHKRYPAAAQARQERGVVLVSFEMDRGGRLLTSRVERTSGHAALDDEALALLARAQPFPSPPPELAGAQVRVAVPIRFNLR